MMMLPSLAAAILSVAAAAPADPKAPIGSWSGTLDAGAAKLPLVLRVEADGAGLKATFDSPDQGVFAMKVDSIEAKGGALSFAIKRVGGSFRGTIDAAGTGIAGTWTQGGALPLSMAKGDAATLAAPAVPKALEGIWEGRIERANIRLVVRVRRMPDGSLILSADSPDQGVEGLGVNKLALEKGELTFEVKAVKGSYRGTFDPAAGTIKGTWMQGGAKLGLDLAKTDKVREANRPQTPRPPFPYRAEEVSYPNPAAALTLAGTLTIPATGGPHPAVVLITGSGPQDRDETLFGHKPFLVLADALTRRGVAVLRVDDRGVGKSTGEFGAATSKDFAGDVRAGLAYLRTRPEVDGARLGLIGHSEGGLIAPMVAAEEPGVSMLVLMAGTGVPGSEILRHQRALILKAAGADAEMLKATDDALGRLVAAASKAPSPAEAAEALKAERAAIEPTLPAASKASVGPMLDADVGLMSGPWFLYFAGFDPRPTLARVRCPVLAINGGADLQVDPRQNLPEIEKALKAGGNPDVTAREVPGLNHLFQASATGSPSEYGRIEETIAPAALAAIVDWVAAHSGLK